MLVSQTKSDHDLAANRTQENLDKQRKHIEESVKKMTKAASGKGGDQKKSNQARTSPSTPIFSFFFSFSSRSLASLRKFTPHFGFSAST